ncbi:MAG: MCP four helix bundle domain-containing protein [Curvibacter lanceolatus]|jgi:methyl-accepting chemotaxis protein|uniref:methyl-accepting chemotaxis protein n=1 Tax=Curvibacter lanceolatus TaxID=86182 RepID=UPI000369B7A4|nr:methyl-accepting chemotaxis protein [Curvibacter lanceolatus]MBV5293084.1 MCP four helix bundle domain-containing protein [Curvibacter lanceolatus]
MALLASSRIRLAPRLALAFGVVCLVMSLAAGIGVWRLVQLQGIADDLGGDSSERALLARELHAIVVISSSRAETLLLIDNPAFAARIDADRKATSARSAEVRKRLDALATDAASRDLFTAIDQAGNAFREARDKLVKQKAAGEAVSEDSIRGLLRPAADRYAAAVDQLAEHQRQRVAEARAAALSSQRQGISLLVTGSVVGLLLSVVSALWLARSILRPVDQASGLAAHIAQGDLTQPVPAEQAGQRDEVLALLARLGHMQSRLVELVAGMRSASAQVANASHEIAAGNNDFSARTEQTASNLEEVAASMEELLSTVQHSADSAQQAEGLATSASQVAVQGREVVQRVVATMDAISGSSRRIADITSVIDGIAFQTNILALNAAVEAARAGEQGRGFAVVAGEVRVLAQRAATAAKEIRDLIASSVSEVGTGAQLVQQAGATMGDIVDSVARVGTIVAELSHSAREQSSGLGQVNEAVVRLDQITQQNAALVEESAAAAQGLRSQAQQLADLVETFRLPGTAGAPPPLRLG